MSNIHSLEEYALNPAVRTELVKNTSPGTEEYYLLNLKLHLQQLQDANTTVTEAAIDKVTALLNAARESRVVSDASVLDQFANQLAVLAFDAKPELLLKELNFDKETYTSLTSAGAAAEDDFEDLGLEDPSEALPSGLDQKLVSSEALVQKLVEDLKQNAYTTVPQAVWPRLLAQPAMESILLSHWTPSELRNHFSSMQTAISARSLEIINKADTIQVDRLIVKVILRLHGAGQLNFVDNLEQFRYLTNEQLQEIQKSQSEFIHNEAFVGLLEQRIVPEPFAESEDVAYKAWLEKMLQFVEKLSPKFNYHKLSVYLLSLEEDLTNGVWDANKFLKFIAIPRNHSHYSRKALEKVDRNHVVNLYYSSRLDYWSNRVTPATSTRDEEVVEEYLVHFMKESKSYSKFEPYFDVKEFLSPLLARTMLMAGEKDVEKWQVSRHLASHESLATLSKKTIIRFAPDNPTKFLPSDSVVFNLRAKNAKRILVRVFEIKTFEYLQQHEHASDEDALGLSLNLDGLTPNWEHHLMLDKPSIEMHDVTIELTELANRRGAFVLDVISNGENSSAYFTKGRLDFIERQSIAGHVITIVDEAQKKLVDKTSPNSDGDIVIPYRKDSTSSSGKIYLLHDGFATRRPFEHRVEYYNMKMSCHIDNEAMVAGTTAKAVIRPVVQISGSSFAVPVSLLERVTLRIESEDTNGITATKTVPDFKVHDIEWSEYNFQVPENLRQITFNLSARIKVIATGEYQDLVDTKQFSFSSAVCQGEVMALLHKGSDGYKLLVVGKNGEKRSRATLQVRLSHPYSSDAINAYLRTDSAGVIRLGLLKDVTKVTCVSTRQEWQLLGRERAQYPSVIHGIAGDTLALPLYRQDIDYVRGISLFAMTEDPTQSSHSTCAIKDFTDHASLREGVLSIKNLTAGFYVLKLDEYQRISIVIANSKTHRSTIPGLEEYLIASNPMLQLPETSNRPLYMGTPNEISATKSLEIQLYNWTSETRLCIIASKFTPTGTAFENLSVLEAEEPWSMKKTELTSTSFQSGRVLGDEYQYVLNRKAQSAHWAGNLLTKPSVLLAPWAVSNSTTVTNTVMQGEQVLERAIRNSARNMGHAKFGRAMKMCSAVGGAGYEIADKIPLLTFLVNPSVTLVNVMPNLRTGLVQIPIAALKASTFLEIFAVDGTQSVQQSFSIAGAGPVDFQKRDLRFKTQVDYRMHYISEKVGIQLDPTSGASPATAGADASTLPSSPQDSSSGGVASITLNSTGSSSSAVRVINSVSQVFDLMLTLLPSDGSEKQDLRTFGFITDWSRLSSDAKKEKYSQWSCHELNLFLYKKDREFFDTVVAPFLKNKLIKSFLDEYLLEAPLDQYTSLKQFSLLSCMEKCLLAQRIPSMVPSVLRWLKDHVPDVGSGTNARLFSTVMKSGALHNVDGSDSDGSEDDDEGDDSPPSSPELLSLDVKKKKKIRSASRFLETEAFADEVNEYEVEERAQDMAYSAAPGNFEMVSYMAAPAPPPLPSGSLPSAPMPAPMMMSRAAPTRARNVDLRKEAEKVVKKQFKPLDLTKEMAETYYYNRKDIAPVNKIEANLFWLDFVEWVQSKDGLFLSQNFVANAGSFTDAMATLALVDVAFKAKEPTVARTAEQNLEISSQSPSIVFHSSTKELSSVVAKGTVLVTQQYYAQDEKHVFDEKLKVSVRRYIQPTAEFRPLESYGAHVVLMNASSTPLKIQLELQIPQGSISIYDALESSKDIHLSPHGSYQCEYGFYFPEQGDFAHYPAHVSSHDEVIAFAAPTLLRVRDPEPNRRETDTTSWAYVLKSGSKEDIVQKLANGTLTNFSESQLMPRLGKDGQFLQQVASALRSRQDYRDTIWLQSLVVSPKNVNLVREYLEHQDYFVRNMGDWFTSKYIVCRPHVRLENAYDPSIQFLEYFPLVNSRVHKANRDATISNDQFKQQYTRFLDLLSRKPQLEAGDLLVLIVYLLAQDRILEAKKQFVTLTLLLKSGEQASPLQQLQYDYLHAYLSLCVEIHGSDDSGAGYGLDLDGVLQILAKYKNYPIERWDRMFKDMQVYVDEILQSLNETEGATSSSAATSIVAGESTAEAGSLSKSDSSLLVDVDDEEGEGAVDSKEEEDKKTKKKKEEKGGADGSDVEASVDFKIGSDSVIAIRHRGVDEVTVEYYSIDAEAMFSSSPLTFSDQGESEKTDSLDATSSLSTVSDAKTNSYRLVKPNGVDTHVVKRAVTKDGHLMVPIVPQYLNTNVMISVSTSPPATTKSWKAYYSQTIMVQCLDQSGTIKVVSKTDGRPVRGGYVKVYAEMKEGGKNNNTSFWKDGYTDLVGRFAYAQVSSGAENGGGLKDVRRFVVFVDGGKEGCAVKTVPVPPV
ncbi:hypothetical protein BGZ94_004440 [Podila epigama]|nr:hypothetical protein BGZ94_004440 [Podila epigama]